MKNVIRKAGKWFHRLLSMLLSPRFLLCFGIGWMITNGWSYVLLVLGTALHWPWAIGVASAYLAFLWIPGTPEKIVTVAIALWLLKVLFPRDQKSRSLAESFRPQKNRPDA